MGRWRDVLVLVVVSLVAPVATAPHAGTATPPGFVPAQANPIPIPPRSGIADSLQLSNWWRSFAAYSDGAPLTPLSWSGDLASSAQNHVDYLGYLRSVGSGYCGHGTDPAFPPLNSNPRSHNVLFCGMRPQEAIDGWMATPLHGGPFVDPTVRSLGLGWNAAGGSAAGFVWGPADGERIGVYPAPDGVLPLLSWWGGEVPDPTAACPPEPGVDNGAPVMLFLPGVRSNQSVDYRLISWSLQDDLGASVPACALKWVDQVPLGSNTGLKPYLFPRRPFVQGMRYRARLSVQPVTIDGSPVGAPVDLDWHFTAIDHRLPRGQRLLDTRDGWFNFRPPGSQVHELGVAGRFGVPADASGVVLNVTATEPSAAGFLTVWPCGTAAPLASNLNVQAGGTVPNLVVVRPGTQGRVCMFSSMPSHVVVDLQGWMPSTFSSTRPTRVLETRRSDGQIGYVGDKPGAGAVIEVPLGSHAPTGPGSASVLNLTATEPEADGFVTVWPCGTDRPWSSNLNFGRGDTRANAVVVRPGTDGKVCLFSSARTHLLVDVAGGITRGFESTTAVRRLDTRPAPDRVGHTGGKPTPGSTTRVALGDLRPPGTSGVVLNVTATNPAGDGFVTVWPCDGAQPVASNLNYATGRTVANLALVSPGGSGDVCIYTQRSADLVVDLLGWQI